LQKRKRGDFRFLLMSFFGKKGRGNQTECEVFTKKALQKKRRKGRKIREREEGLLRTPSTFVCSEEKKEEHFGPTTAPTANGKSRGRDSLEKKKKEGQDG